MKAKKKIILAIAFIALALTLWKLYLGSGDISARASFGYDDRGKFIAFNFDRPIYLRKVQIGSDEHPVNREVGQSYVLRYNWRERRDYNIRLNFGRGDLFIPGTAPSVEARLEGVTRFYHAYYGGEKVAVAETRLFSIENEEVKAYFTSAGGIAERVVILKYPPVLTSPRVYEDFSKKLRAELKKLGVRVEVSRKPTDRGEMLIVAGGAWPMGLNRTRNIIYIGASPGEVLVREDSSLAMGRTWENIVAKPGKMMDDLKFRESAYSAVNPDWVVAYREDGLPGVFKVDGALIFSNTLDMGWNSVDDAVEDVVKAVITWGFMPSAERSFRLDGDARNFTFILHTRIGNETGKLGLALASEKTGKVEVHSVIADSARVKGPGNTYPGEEVVLTAYIPAGDRALGVMVTGEGGGSAELESEPTQGVDVRRIRASFTEPGDHLVKVTGDGEVLGAALIHVKHIEARPLRIETGVRGTVMLMVTDDGEPYRGEASLFIDGDEVLNKGIKEGVLRYRGNVPKEADIVVYIHGKRYRVETAPAGLLPRWVRPYHIALTVLMLLAALFSALARERESRVVTIEMPDEVDGEEVYVKAESVLKAFDLYNRRMRWEKLPMTIVEVQRALYLFGVSKGYPSMGSVEKLLDKDMSLDVPNDDRRIDSELCVRKVYGYYAPYRWETKGQRIEHLAMIRIAYEWMVRSGIESKALTTSVFTKGYPDVIGVASQEIMKAVLGNSPRWEETVLLVECETGEKPEGDDAFEKLAHVLKEKFQAFKRKPKEAEPEEESSGATGRAKTPEAGEIKTPGKKKAEEVWKYRPWLLKDAVLVFILSPVLYDAFEALKEKPELKRQGIFDDVLVGIKEKKVFVYSVEEIASCQ